MFRVPAARRADQPHGLQQRGLDAFVANVSRSTYRSRGGILGLNIGKNADTPIERAVDDYLTCLDGVYPHADYVTVNISLAEHEAAARVAGRSTQLGGLLAQLKRRQTELADRHGRYVPLAVKIAPDLDLAQIDLIADALVAHRIDGVIATNTTLSREAVAGLPHANEEGGLSGAPLAAASTRVVEALHRRVAGQLPIIGVGGIVGGDDARAKRAAGARLVQLYTRAHLSRAGAGRRMRPRAARLSRVRDCAIRSAAACRRSGSARDRPDGSRDRSRNRRPGHRRGPS